MATTLPGQSHSRISEGGSSLRVSVVIPAFNAEAFLRRTLDSVLSQSFRELEVVLVDDGSTDATVRVAREAGEKVTVVEGPRQGVSAARNAGIRRSRGRYVAFMDHDDLWHPEKLARQVEILDADARAGLVFTQAVIEEPGVANQVIPQIERPDEFLQKAYENLVHRNYIPMSSVMVRREALLALPGPFDPAYKLSEDWDLWLRLAARLGEGGIRYIAEPLTRYMIVAGRASERMGDLRLEDIALFERETRENPWLVASAPARCRATRYRLHHVAGYFLLLEGRPDEARRVLKQAWLARPWSLKPLLALIKASIDSPAARRLHRGVAAGDEA